MENRFFSPLHPKGDTTNKNYSYDGAARSPPDAYRRRSPGKFTRFTLSLPPNLFAYKQLHLDLVEECLQ